MPKNLSRGRTSLAVLAALAAGALATPSDATTLKLNSLAFTDEDAQWKAYTYLARDTVSTLNDLSSRGAEELSNRLDMSSRSPWARLLFLGTVGQAQARFAWANSVMAHEYAHFANAHRFGLTEHYFVDEDTGEVFDWQEAWWRTFLGGDPGGPATSAVGEEGFDYALDQEEGVERSLAGLSWQMGYSEHRLRQWLHGDDRTIFDAADMMLSRIYTLSYAVGSHTGANGSETGGDIGRFERTMEEDYGEENVNEKVIAASLIANLFSPAMLSIMGDFGTYVTDGSLGSDPHQITTTSGHGFTWDIPQYLNKDNMSLVPTLYWLPNNAVSDKIGADNLVLGLGVETSVIGASHQELRATIDGTWDKIQLSAGASLAKNGQYLELEASYNLNGTAAIAFGTAQAFGETQRGARDLPDADNVAWLGLNLRF